MSSSSLLLRIPGTPFSINDLRPDTQLAALAASLLARRQRTTILDYGTVEMLEALFPTALCAPSSRELPEAQATAFVPGHDIETGLVAPTPFSRPIQDQQKAVWERVGEKIAARRDFDYAILVINHPKDLIAARIVSKRLRALLPRVRLVACGPAFNHNQDLVSKMVRTFDAVYLGMGGQSDLRLAELLEDTKSWHEIPDLAYIDGVRYTLTPSETPTDNAPLPCPAFEPEIYPAIGEQTKLQLFDIEEIRSEDHADTGIGALPCYQKPLEDVLEEIRSLREQYHVHAFHFSGCLQNSPHALDLARELLSRKMQIRYSRDAHISSTAPHSIGSLSASGCQAVDFRIGTGSQLLLDRYHGSPFGVSEVERVMRRTRFSDLFASTHYIFPTPEDDHHTLAESLRLIDRSHPDSVTIHLPNANGARTSRGHLFHEFRPFRKHAQKRAAAENESFRNEVEELGVDQDISARFALLAELAGHRGREVEFKEQFTHQLLSGDTFGISSTIQRINERATMPERIFQLKPFTPSQDAIAN